MTVLIIWAIEISSKMSELAPATVLTVIRRWVIRFAQGYFVSRRNMCLLLKIVIPMCKRALIPKLTFKTTFPIFAKLSLLFLFVCRLISVILGWSWSQRPFLLWVRFSLITVRNVQILGLPATVWFEFWCEGVQLQGTLWFTNGHWWADICASWRSWGVDG